MMRRWQRLGMGWALAAVIAGCGVPTGTPASIGSAGALAQRFLTLKPDLPAAESARQATLFTYVAMDDDLSRAGEMLLNGVERTASDRVHDVAFADFKGPDNSFLFHLQQDSDTTRVTSPRSPLAPDLKEVDATDPAVLAATVNWAFSNYPAPFKAMKVLAHGRGWFGLVTDESRPDKLMNMSVAEFGAGLRQGLKGRKLDLIDMLSCLMSNVEFAYELRDSAKVLVASEHPINVGDQGLVELPAALNAELAKPNPDARTIGRQMAILADAKNPHSNYYSAAAVDLERMGDLKRTVNQLANTLLRALPRQAPGILAAYDAVPAIEYDVFGNRDLWNFCTRLAAIPDPAVQDAAQGVKATLRKVLIHAKDRTGDSANGLSIMLPHRALLARMDFPAYYKAQGLEFKPAFKAALGSSFAKATSWDRFILEVQALGATYPPPKDPDDF